MGRTTLTSFYVQARSGRRIRGHPEVEGDGDDGPGNPLHSSLNSGLRLFLALGAVVTVLALTSGRAAALPAARLDSFDWSRADA